MDWIKMKQNQMMDWINIQQTQMTNWMKMEIPINWLK